MKRRVAISLLSLCTCGLAAPARSDSQPTLQVWADTGFDYANYKAVPLGTVWDMAIIVGSPDLEVAAVQFNFPWRPPGVLAVVTQYSVGNTTNSGDASAGQYWLDFGGCAPPCDRLEVLRVTYANFGAEVEQNTVLEIYGPQGPGSVPVLQDCGGAEHEAPMGGTPGGTTCEVKIEVPPGAAVLNGAIHACVLRRYYFMEHAPYGDCDAVVAARATSMSTLKGRF